MPIDSLQGSLDVSVRAVDGQMWVRVNDVITQFDE